MAERTVIVLLLSRFMGVMVCLRIESLQVVFNYDILLELLYLLNARILMDYGLTDAWVDFRSKLILEDSTTLKSLHSFSPL